VIVKQILAKEGKKKKESKREREREREERLPTVRADKNLGQPDHFSRRPL